MQFIQPPGTPPTEVLQFSLPPSAVPWLHAVAHYLRQNLLIFLHTPKYTDSNVEHHFKVSRAGAGTGVCPASAAAGGIRLGSSDTMLPWRVRGKLRLTPDAWGSFTGLSTS